jgi:glycerol-3-phosphate dehydrogenase
VSAADYDVVVVGGGIHGAGVAQAMAAAGYRTLVLEKTAVAAGTSRSSSKLIHGGLRYLESLQLPLVYESLRERAILLRIAPQLVRLVTFHIPIYARTTRRPWKIRTGLALYAALGGFAPACRFDTLARSAWAGLDGLDTRGLQRVFRYQDAQTDDAALTRAVMRSARTLGATLICPARFVAAARDAAGLVVSYNTPQGDHTCTTSTLVVAAGPWSGDVTRLITPALPMEPTQLVQGTHIVLPGRLTQGVYYVEAPWDRRAVFIMPWYDRTLVGTTETAYHGDPGLVQPRAEEIRYLQTTYTHYFPTRPTDIIDSFAGLRVLPAGAGSAFHRPRETRLHTDRPQGPRVVTIDGGKLTGYRATAAKVVALLRQCLPAHPPKADTATLLLTPD